MYIIASSEDSKDIYPNNSWTDFTVELPKQLDLSDNYSVALTHIFFNYKFRKSCFYIFTSICETSVVKAEERNFLALFSEPGGVSNPLYLKINQNTVKRIRFIILDQDLKTPKIINSNNSSPIITLTLQIDKNGS